MNFPLFSMMFSIAATVIIGLLMIIALVVGYDEIINIIMVAVVGFVISIPVAFVLTKKMSSITGDE